jgi:hypothetical protein
MRETVKRFGAANRGTKACQFCGVLSWASRQDDTANRAMCQGCCGAAGLENEHQDGYHEAGRNGYDATCPTCNPAGEEKRLAKAAARVAAYGVAAAAKAEKAVAREARYPHCPHCGQRRPKTKAWERTGVADICGDCKWIKEQGTWRPNDAEYQTKMAAEWARRKDRYTR